MEKFREVLNLLFKYRTAMGYSLVTLLTAGSERIFSTTVFQCPCSATWNLRYVLVFLLVPALTLFILGYVLKSRTWRLLTGCCEHRSSNLTTGQSCQVFWEITLFALVAPFTWCAVALLGGTFYECGASAVPSIARRVCAGKKGNCTEMLPKVPCLQNVEPDLQDLLRELRAQSQVWGWILIALIIICLLIVKCIARCIYPASFQYLKFLKIYENQEKKILKTEAKQCATEMATVNVKCFFEQKTLDESNIQSTIPNLDAWKQISLPYTFNSEEPYYSLLHKYVSMKDKSTVTSSSKKDTTVTTFTFEDSEARDNDNS